MLQFHVLNVFMVARPDAWAAAAAMVLIVSPATVLRLSRYPSSACDPKLVLVVMAAASVCGGGGGSSGRLRVSGSARAVLVQVVVSSRSRKKTRSSRSSKIAIF